MRGSKRVGQDLHRNLAAKACIRRAIDRRLEASEALFRDFQALTPYPYTPFVRSFDSFDEYERWRRAQTNPGTDNRVLRVCRLLNRARVRYLIAGGVAANLHGSVRATKDVDLLVPVNEANMARLLDALSELPWGLARELDAADLAKKPITISWPRSGCPGRDRVIAKLPTREVSCVVHDRIADLEVARQARVPNRVSGCPCRRGSRPEPR